MGCIGKVCKYPTEFEDGTTVSKEAYILPHRARYLRPECEKIAAELHDRNPDWHLTGGVALSMVYNVEGIHVHDVDFLTRGDRSELFYVGDIRVQVIGLKEFNLPETVLTVYKGWRTVTKEYLMFYWLTRILAFRKGGRLPNAVLEALLIDMQLKPNVEEVRQLLGHHVKELAEWDWEKEPYFEVICSNLYEVLGIGLSHCSQVIAELVEKYAGATALSRS